MKDEPLFIKFLNGDAGSSEVINAVLNASDHEKSRQIAINKKNEEVNLSYFRSDFRKVMIDLTDNGISQRIINYVDSYMKPSLLELGETNTGSRSGEKRYVIIKAEDAPWIEAIICYNLCVYIRGFGIESIKQCQACSKFFTHKGKYAKYCSEICKASGSSK